jgi:hypothetical protein
LNRGSHHTPGARQLPIGGAGIAGSVSRSVSFVRWNLTECVRACVSAVCVCECGVCVCVCVCVCFCVLVCVDERQASPRV